MARLFTALKSDMGGISGALGGAAGAAAGVAQGMQDGLKMGLAMRQAERDEKLDAEQLKKLKYENALHSYKLGGSITSPTQGAPMPGAALGNGGPIESQPSGTPDRQGFDKVATVNPSVATRLQQRYDHAQAVLADPTSTPDQRLEAEVWIGETRREASEFLQSDEVVAYTESQYRQQIRTWAEQAGFKEPGGLNDMTGTELEETLRTTGLAWQNAWRRAQMTDQVQEIAQRRVNKWIEENDKKALPEDAQDAVEKIQMGPPADIMSRADLKAWYDKAITELAVGLADPTAKDSYNLQLRDLEGQLAASRQALDDYEAKRTWAEGIAGSRYPAAEGSGLAYDVTAAFKDNPIFAARLEAFVGEEQALVFSNTEYIKGMLQEAGVPEPTSKDQFEVDQYWSDAIKRYLTRNGMTVDDLYSTTMRGNLKAKHEVPRLVPRSGKPYFGEVDQWEPPGGWPATHMGRRVDAEGNPVQVGGELWEAMTSEQPGGEAEVGPLTALPQRDSTDDGLGPRMAGGAGYQLGNRAADDVGDLPQGRAGSGTQEAAPLVEEYLSATGNEPEERLERANSLIEAAEAAKAEQRKASKGSKKRGTAWEDREGATLQEHAERVSTDLLPFEPETGTQPDAEVEQEALLKLLDELRQELAGAGKKHGRGAAKIRRKIKHEIREVEKLLQANSKRR